MQDCGRYEDIADAGVIIYLLYEVMYGTLHWQDPAEQLGGWIALVFMIVYCWIICAIDTEREMMNKYFKVEKHPLGYYVK